MAVKTQEYESAVQRRIHDAAMRLFAERGGKEVNIKELAEEAGVARGTIYAHVKSIDRLFAEVAGALTVEMNQRVVHSFSSVDDPVARLAFGIRSYLRRAHEEPLWGRFVLTFALRAPVFFEEIWQGRPAHDVLAGLERGLYRFEKEQLNSVMMMIGGSVIGAMALVLDGHETWRNAGFDAAEFILRALGVPENDAKAYAVAELPALLSVT